MEPRHKTIAEILAEAKARFLEEDFDPREGKDWPEEEDCKGCDQHRDGPHRFGCTIRGVKQLRLLVKIKEE